MRRKIGYDPTGFSIFFLENKPTKFKQCVRLGEVQKNEADDDDPVSPRPKITTYGINAPEKLAMSNPIVPCKMKHWIGSPFPIQPMKTGAMSARVSDERSICRIL